jgi:AraC family transcriptional regulator of adaptative response/methylated-DNA-[protein]-cysteine methyltransferase
MYDAGYGSSSRLYERANAELGMTPATYKRKGERLNIKYTVVESDFGKLLVALTDKGICAVRLGDSEAELELDLRTEYSAAKLERSHRSVAEFVKKIVAYLSAKLPHLELPLDLRATAFQRQVWEALRNIPYGETRSYSEIAKAIGQPRAVRAVARACATNPVARDSLPPGDPRRQELRWVPLGIGPEKEAARS